MVGALDYPNKRKVHSDPTPRLGGLAIFISFFVCLGLLGFIYPDFYNIIIEQEITPWQGGVLFAALCSVFLLGAWDDMEPLKPGKKFAVQFVAATLICLAGFKIAYISNPFGPGEINLGLLSYPLTIVWIVGVTNAFNLIDGLDGLASGIAVIALLTISSIALVKGQAGMGLMGLLLAGAILGFLWFNFRPAKIFLGDSGSLFLGFCLAFFSIQSYTKVSTTFAIFVPVFVLGLPLVDTILSMIRRFLSWFLPDRSQSTKKISFRQIIHSIFQPDKSHIHHQLLQRGLSHKNTVLVLYAVSGLFGIGAFALSLTTQADTSAYILMAITAIAIAGIRMLKYKEISLLQNGIMLKIYKSLILDRQIFRRLLDGVFIILSFAGALSLLAPDQSQNIFWNLISEPNINVLPVLLAMQMGLFWISGLYRETIQLIGIADVIKILKSVALAVAGSAILFYLIPIGNISFNATLFVIDFYFLGTLVLGMRVSFHLLKHLFYRSRSTQQRVIIYGAGEQGMLTLQRILAFDTYTYTPVGFLDEDPRLKGKYINGYPVYGGHWKLERLIRSKKINEIFISIPTNSIKSEVFRRIKAIANEYDITIRQYQVELTNLNDNTKNFNPENWDLTYAD